MSFGDKLPKVCRKSGISRPVVGRPDESMVIETTWNRSILSTRLPTPATHDWRNLVNVKPSLGSKSYYDEPE